LQYERNRANTAEQQAGYFARVAAQANANAAAAAQVPREDPLDKFAKEGITLPADQQKDLLDRGIRIRQEDESRRLQQHLENRIASQAAAIEANVALQSVLQQNPDITQKPENEDRFKASMLFVNEQARRKGRQLSPLEIAQAAANEYRRAAGNQARPNVPYVEGGSRPDLAPGQQLPPGQGGPEAPSWIKRAFGKKILDIIQPLTDPDIQMEQLTRDYVREKNGGFFKKGVRSDMGEVLAAGEE